MELLDPSSIQVASQSALIRRLSQGYRPFQPTACKRQAFSLCQSRFSDVEDDAGNQPVLWAEPACHANALFRVSRIREGGGGEREAGEGSGARARGKGDSPLLIRDFLLLTFLSLPVWSWVKKRFLLSGFRFSVLLVLSLMVLDFACSSIHVFRFRPHFLKKGPMQPR